MLQPSSGPVAPVSRHFDPNVEKSGRESLPLPNKRPRAEAFEGKVIGLESAVGNWRPWYYSRLGRPPQNNNMHQTHCTKSCSKDTIQQASSITGTAASDVQPWRHVWGPSPAGSRRLLDEAALSTQVGKPMKARIPATAILLILRRLHDEFWTRVEVVQVPVVAHSRLVRSVHLQLAQGVPGDFCKPLLLLCAANISERLVLLQVLQTLRGETTVAAP